MKHADSDKIKISSNRSFGLLFFVVFLIVSLWPLTYEGSIRIWSVIISAVFLILGLINSKLLAPLNLLWFKFGILLGSIIAPILLTLIYFVTILPTGLIMRLLGKDLLQQKIVKNAKSYWVERTEAMGSMKNQF